MTGNKGGPIPLAKPAATWSHAAGKRHPKSIAFFVAVLPQFTNRASGHVTEQVLVLGLLFPLMALVLDSVWALLAGTAETWLARSPRRLAAIGGTGGLLMIGIGVSFAVAGRKD